MTTLFTEFAKTARRYPSRNAVHFFHEEDLLSWTYLELYNKVLTFAAGLLDLGLKKGSRVALLAQNGPCWNLVDLAVAKNGMVLVPIHTTLSVEQIKYILRKSQVDALAFESTGSLPSLSLYDLIPSADTIMDNLTREISPKLKHLILMDPGMDKQHNGKRIHHISKVMERGTRLIEGKKAKPAIKVGPKDISTLMYTSGTTGEMKGVLLTHRNLVSNMLAGYKRIGFSHRDLGVIPIPLSHALGRMTALGCLIPIGCSVFYERRLARLVQGLQDLRPMGMVAVPRLLEKMYEAVLTNIENRSRIGARIFKAGLHASNRYYELREKNSPWTAIYQLQDRISDRLMYQKIRKLLGGRLKHIVCGGSALDPEISRFFQAIGIIVIEGYGLTETSPIVTLNNAKKPKIGSVGTTIPGVEVKIGKNDEILVKGPNVMVGYEGNAKETHLAIDREGWFHTGDQGYLDKDGYLYITGRIKEVIVTSYGKNIAPTSVEHVLERSRYLKQVMVYGNDLPYLTALIVLDQPTVKEWCRDQHISKLSWPQICKRKEVVDLIESKIEQHSKSLAAYEKVKKFHIIPDDFTQENGLLTPTLKLKRRLIIEKYREELEEMY